MHPDTRWHFDHGSPIAKGEHSRGYLPHCDHAGRCQFVTFSLATARAVLAARRLLGCEVDDANDGGERIDLVRDPRLAEVVQRSIVHWDGVRYLLHAWCIMPDHVHAVVAIDEGHSLGRIVHSWKSFTAKRINFILGRQGRLWQPDYFDRVVRRGCLDAAIGYVEMNPVHGGLVERPVDWPYSSATRRARRNLDG